MVWFVLFYCQSLTKTGTIYRHLYNFFLLFASNVENFVAFLLRSFVSGKLITTLESILAVVYLYAVIRNLIWFIQPLTERDEYTSLVDWIEDELEVYVEFIQKVVDKGKFFVDKVCIWRKKKTRDGNNNPNSHEMSGSKRSSFLRRSLTGEKLQEKMALEKLKEEKKLNEGKKLSEGKKLNGVLFVGEKLNNTKPTETKPTEKKPTEKKPTKKKPNLKSVDFRNSSKRQGGVIEQLRRRIST